MTLYRCVRKQHRNALRRRLSGESTCYTVISTRVQVWDRGVGAAGSSGEELGGNFLPGAEEVLSISLFVLKTALNPQLFENKI